MSKLKEIIIKANHPNLLEWLKDENKSLNITLAQVLIALTGVKLDIMNIGSCLYISTFKEQDQESVDLVWNLTKDLEQQDQDVIDKLLELVKKNT